MKNILAVIVFYFQNSLFCNKEKGFLWVYFSLMFSLYLIIQSSVKLYKQYDIFNTVYLTFGIILLTIYLIKAFEPSYQKHKIIKKHFEYKGIRDFYKNNL